MNFKAQLRFRWLLPAGYALLVAFAGPSAIANVYPTAVTLNGKQTTLTAPPGATVKISYILNEPASQGVTIEIRNEGDTVRSLSLPAGSPGTLRGKNEITWDGKDASGAKLLPGTYVVQVTARCSGYPNWTQITDEMSDASYVWEGSSIAINRNASSPYYGRIFVANAYPGLSSRPGDIVGILKFNADGSPAEEGVHETGGYSWAGNHTSPWKMEVSEDDYVFISDLGANGTVTRWDQKLSPTSRIDVLRNDNVVGRKLSGPAVSGAGTNLNLFAADTKPSSSGIRKYAVTGNGVCATNDSGQTVIGFGGGSLTLPPADVAVDKYGNVYTIQSVDAVGDPAQRVFRFKAYDPGTNSGFPLLTAEWAVGSGDDSFGGASGLAVDPTGTYVAVSFRGIAGLDNGNTKILYATNGQVAVDLDLGLEIYGLNIHDDADCAWDAAGNIYYTDVLAGVWRAFSPPGPNEFTTIAPATLEIIPPPPPLITAFTRSGETVTIDFTAAVYDQPSNFIIVGSPILTGPYSQVPASIIQVADGLFRATVPLGSEDQYYRVTRYQAPLVPPYLTGISFAGGLVLLDFTGYENDVAQNFFVVSATAANGIYKREPLAIVQRLSPGVFRARVTPSGDIRFFRILR